MTALIILAAGESSRLGQPKQNLIFKGKTLLQLAVDAGLKSDCATVIVVLGANSKQINPIPETATLCNKNWKEGMASSIKMAMLEIDKDATFDKVIIMLCDQPFVNAALLNSLIKKQAETQKAIVACAYNGTTGVPVLFDSKLFGELLLLKGKEGAKKILKNHAAEIAEVVFEKGGIDIDTPEDYENLLTLSD
ncbi:nucleotidyltransferase family protein [Mucilaginibacter jinjuensis]|uniref:Nucleotidyltransferase family protein n=1 Tax=Mucilaginibacter jinjuensis TaxID=1176721 RepID=A0ABY7TD69_9SPHI|nr:nucleotidyltransferase family protein [Mucilaginibacter jinjuensis]WCT14312.1 nucleotidyltransferase family protein [Mucilaginibacter jinjuensis]